MVAAVGDIKFDHILETLLTKTVKTGRNRCLIFCGLERQKIMELEEFMEFLGIRSINWVGTDQSL